MGKGRSPDAKGCSQLLWSGPLSTIRLKGGLGTAHLYVRLKVCVCVYVSDVMEQVSSVMKPRF